MDFLIRTSYLVGSIIIVVYVYYWSSAFKKLGASTIDELNEEEEDEIDLVDASEAKFINYFGTITFLVIGTVIWTLLGLTVGKIAGDIIKPSMLQWLDYFLMYFLFLRLPFGVGNKMVKSSYDFKNFPEKLPFALAMILAYVFSICCYESLPGILKWHLIYLN